MKGLIIRDLRYSVRSLVKRPAFAIIVILTLALGLGANTAIFSIVDAVLIHKLPYNDPDKLVLVWETTQQSEHNPMSQPNFVDYKAQNHVFENMAAFVTRTFAMQTASGPTLTRAGLVSPGFFELLGSKPMLGRTFHPEEGDQGNDNVVILSYGFWVQNFGSDPNILGKTIFLDCNDPSGTCPSIMSKTSQVIGVMPANFDFEIPGFFRNPTFWRPLVLVRDNTQRSNSFLKVIARIRPDVTMRQAQMDIEQVSLGLQKNYATQDAGINSSLVGLHDQIVGDVRPALLLLSTVVFFVLLIICVNITNLQLERSNSRQKEIAIRVALGAKRSDLLRQLFLESWLLSLFGGGLGILFALLLLKTLGLFADQIPRGFHVVMSSQVFGVSMLLSILTAVLIGIVPALHANSRMSLVTSMKEASQTSLGRYFGRTRDLLVISELAISLVLLVASGLLVKSLSRILAVPLGFETENVLAARIQLPASLYPDSPRQLAYYKQAAERVSGLPGVQAVGGIDDLPLQGSADSDTFFIEGRPMPLTNELPEIQVRTITSGYFNALRIPLIKGRAFTDTDVATSPLVALINRAFVQKFFPNGDPVGQHLRLGTAASSSPSITIIGVVADSRDIRLESPPEPEIYKSYEQFPSPHMSLAVRSQVDPHTLIPTMRKAFRGLDKKLPAFAIIPMATEVEKNLQQRRAIMFQVNLFAALALLLAAMGTYGVVAYSTVQRTKEIGIRMALGAQRTNVLGLILRQGAYLAIGGIVAGTITSLACSRIISRFVFGVGAFDFITYGAVIILLLTVVLLASFLPARRASRVNPIIALRYE
ncbi:MAG: ABC transporter permease [Candidatus Angelobacter sp.]